MRNKQDKRVLIVKQQKNVYIISKIASNLNKFALIIVIYKKCSITLLAINNTFN